MHGLYRFTALCSYQARPNEVGSPPLLYHTQQDGEKTDEAGQARLEKPGGVDKTPRQC